jgi:hypothetical protein
MVQISRGERLTVVRAWSRIDLANDPPWDMSPSRTESVLDRLGWVPSVALLFLSAATAFSVALSTFLPWYKTAMPGSGRFRPTSRWLMPPLGGSAHAPGTTAWGHLLTAAALAVAVLAAIDAGVTARTTTTRSAGPLARHVMVTAAATILIVVVVLEVRARPPFGDGPPLWVDWGAVLGTAAAAACAATSWWALAASISAAKHPMPAPPKSSSGIAS